MGLFGGAPWASLPLSPPPPPHSAWARMTSERESTPPFFPSGEEERFRHPCMGGGEGASTLAATATPLPPSSLRRGMSSLPSMACDAPRKGGEKTVAISVSHSLSTSISPPSTLLGPAAVHTDILTVTRSALYSALTFGRATCFFISSPGVLESTTEAPLGESSEQKSIILLVHLFVMVVMVKIIEHYNIFLENYERALTDRRHTHTRSYAHHKWATLCKNV